MKNAGARWRAWLTNRRVDRARWALAIVLLLAAAVLPPVSLYLEGQGMIESARFEIVLGVTSLILALWAVSYNLMLGYAGMVSFAHAAYYGVGAYTVAILLQRYQISYFAALAAAPLVAATVGIITGFVVFFYERQRHKSVVRNVRMITAMNHHVRNALQSIMYVPYSPTQADQVKVIQASVERIQWALREILPGEISEGQAFSQGPPAPKS